MTHSHGIWLDGFFTEREGFSWLILHCIITLIVKYSEITLKNQCFAACTVYNTLSMLGIMLAESSIITIN